MKKKIKTLISHATTGIHHEKLGYKLVKVFYAFSYYDEEIERKIIKELKTQQNIIWAARYYGPFDVSIALLVKDLNQLMSHIEEFNSKFSNEISNKRIELISKQIFFRHEYLHKNPTKKIQIQKNYNEKPLKLTKTDKKIITAIINEPRKSIISIAEETRLNPKTITTRIKELEKKKIITGYFITINNSLLKIDTFKLLIQIRSGRDTKALEEYLQSIKSIKHIRKMIGYWDYEIDLMYKTNEDLHKDIEKMKKKFPRIFKKIDIASFEKRIITNKKEFLFEN